MKIIRIVLDANVYASALMKSEGLPAYTLKAILEDPKYELVLSQDILDEIQRILNYPKVRKRIHHTEQELNAWLDALYTISYIARPLHQYPSLVPDDPDDEIYLIAAIESRAKYIISGDKHLLNIQKFEGIKIVSAREFLDSILK